MKKKNIIKIIKLIIIIFLLSNIFIQVNNLNLFSNLFSISRKLLLLINLSFVCLLIISITYGILNFEKLYKVYKENNDKKSIWIALYFSVLTSLIFNPLSNTNVVDFDRIIGNGILFDYDVSIVISNFNRFFMFLGAFIILFYLIINSFRQNASTLSQKKAIKFLDNIIIIANIHLFFKFINYFYDKSVIISVSSCFIILLVCTVLFYLFLNLDKKITFDNYIKIYIISVLFSVLGAILLSVPLTTPFDSGFLMIGIQFIILVLFLLIIKLSKLFDYKCKEIVLNSAVISFSFIPLLISIYVETINILNQYEIFVENPSKYIFLLLILCIILFVILVIVFKKKNIESLNWKKIVYPLIVIGFSSLSVQMSLQVYYGADMFESANYSVLISDFLNFGEIPIIEHYGGHMLSGVGTGILYGIINNDFLGAIFSPYAESINILLILSFYYLIKNIWDEDSALYASLLFPILSTNWTYYGVGIITCLSLINFIKKNSYFSAILFWCSIVFSALYRLDLGFAFSIASIIAFLIYVFVNKDFKHLKKFILTFAITVVLGLGVWFGVCLLKDINPILRILEFIAIGMSNQNWAYSSIGDSRLLVFALSYLVIPTFIIITLVYSIFSSFRKKVSIEIWITLLVLGICYFVNFSRGLVRHSIVEMNLVVVMWCAYVYIAIFISSIKKNIKLVLPIFTGIILISHLFTQNTVFYPLTVFDNSLQKINSFTSLWYEKNYSIGEEKYTYWEKIKLENQKIDRVVWDNNLVETIKPYKYMIDILLDDNETFLDYLNRSFLYSALNKKSPVYVSQSPLQLSGEFSQIEFIKQIEKNNVPIAILPSVDFHASASLDGILNVYRYYKVSEYIYNNYIPLVSYGEFTIWVETDKYEEKVKLLETNKEVPIVNYGYDGPYIEGKNIRYNEPFHSYNIYKLPILWGEKDTKNAVENKVISKTVLNNDIFVLQEEVRNKEKGNYLHLNIDSNTSKSLSLKIGVLEEDKFIEKYKYSFDISDGNHNYIIRVSSDYYWYSENINAIKIDSKENINDIKINVLEGD